MGTFVLAGEDSPFDIDQQDLPVGYGDNLFAEVGNLVYLCHGYRFSLADGTCVDHPEFILRTFHVQISGDDILIDPA